MEVVYEDNHIVIVSKCSGEIVQGDKTGDRTLADNVKAYIKEKYAKPGNVFLGVAHRLDRPVWGLVVFAKTSKALARLNDMFRNITHWLKRNEKQNKSYAYDKEVPGTKKAMLHYKVIGHSERYTLIEIQLLTGRHHQIRCQLAKIGCPIKGDLKYGARRSNPDGSISLLARSVEFIHPVSKEKIYVESPVPNDNLWHAIMP